MKYIRSSKYCAAELQSKIMEPNLIKPGEELLLDCKIPGCSVVCDLGSCQELASVFII